MKKLIEFLKQTKKYNLKYIEQNFLTGDVKEVLFKYNLTIHELCFRLKNNIDLDKQFFCKQCGTKIVFDRKHHYKDFCSRECSGKHSAQSESIKKRIATNIERYGVSCTLQDKNVHQKVLETWKQKYNTDSPNQSGVVKDKKKQAYLKKFRVDNYSKTKEFKEKVKQTNIKKFGKESYTQTDEYKNRVKQTCLEKYGVDHYTKSKDYRDRLKDFKDKYKQTCLEKYGTEYYEQSDVYKKKFNKILAKRKETFKKKYGVESYSESAEYKARLPEIQEKRYQTQKRNHTFNSSKLEKHAYKMLQQKFKEVIFQYKSEKYPFKCDFYIPEKDLYIECHFGFFHNGKPFDKNNIEHLKELEDIKLHANKFKRNNKYKQLIYTWTDLDVRKLECFKKNNLNYKIFYTLDELKDWLTS